MNDNNYVVQKIKINIGGHITTIKKVISILVTIAGSVNILGYQKWDIPYGKRNNGFKCFMERKWVTNKDTAQYRFLFSPKVSVDKASGIYKSNYKIVAVSPKYGRIGDVIFVELDNKRIEIFQIGDYKKTNQTDEFGAHPINDKQSCLVEFIVEKNNLPKDIQHSGNLNRLFPGRVTRIHNFNMTNDRHI